MRENEQVSENEIPQKFLNSILEDMYLLSYFQYVVQQINSFRKSEPNPIPISVTVGDLKTLFGEDFYKQNSLLNFAYKMAENGFFVFVFPKKPDKKIFLKWVLSYKTMGQIYQNYQITLI